MFDPRDDVLTTSGSLSAGRHNHHAVRLTGPDAGKVLIFGLRRSQPSRGALTFELFEPATMRFSLVPNVMLPTQRIGATATALSDRRIMILGGATRAGGGDPLDTALIYDPRTHQLSELTSTMRDARWGPSVVALPNGQLLVFGGGNRAVEREVAEEVHERRQLGVVVAQDQMDRSVASVSASPTSLGRARSSNSAYRLCASIS